mmetsp:Transcript_27709/g.55919  ORF Transcript_27709/g.55919 Transcript_27709/m.55919 type:complete len:102 (-) Transcript_27709:51-356(-)
MRNLPTSVLLESPETIRQKPWVLRLFPPPSYPAHAPDGKSEEENQLSSSSSRQLASRLFPLESVTGHIPPEVEWKFLFPKDMVEPPVFLRWPEGNLSWNRA